MQVGLGYADPPIEPSLLASRAFQHNIGIAIVDVARWIAARVGDDWIMREGIVVGGLGVIGYATITWHAIRCRRSVRTIQTIAFGMSSFALLVGALVCINRSQQMLAAPLQIYADRYVP